MLWSLLFNHRTLDTMWGAYSEQLSKQPMAGLELPSGSCVLLKESPHSQGPYFKIANVVVSSRFSMNTLFPARTQGVFLMGMLGSSRHLSSRAKGHIACGDR